MTVRSYTTFKQILMFIPRPRIDAQTEDLLLTLPSQDITGFTGSIPDGLHRCRLREVQNTLQFFLASIHLDVNQTATLEPVSLSVREKIFVILKGILH